jgi:hypothetical protein
VPCLPIIERHCRSSDLDQLQTLNLDPSRIRRRENQDFWASTAAQHMLDDQNRAQIQRCCRSIFAASMKLTRSRYGLDLVAGRRPVDTQELLVERGRTHAPATPIGS